MANRIIAHFDLDAFFVSVECLLDPSLRGKPLLVGGSRERGVVAACSYEARKFGIHSAMPMKTALQKCPHVTVVSGTRGAYSHYSRIVTDIIVSRAPLVEKASIDEFYIDLTGMNKYFNAFLWTKDLREAIQKETGLPISFGLASNKMVAKIATDEAKPNGYLHIPAGKEQEFLAPLGVNKIPGVGAKTFEVLRSAGIHTIHDIYTRSEEELMLLLGNYGSELFQKSKGIHHGEVVPYQEAKSVSTENTFEENVADMNFLSEEIVRMTEKAAYSLRQENKLCGCITVKIRYPDFSTNTKQASIPYTFYDDELIPVAHDLFKKLHIPGSAVRLLGVRLSELTSEARQTNLFIDDSRKGALYKAIDEVKSRFGKLSISKAAGKQSDRIKE